jgi:hypothetical protein
MAGEGAARSSECQFRDESLRCVFVDGHPGAHVCIGAHSSRVAIRGGGEVPEAVYLAVRETGKGPAGRGATPSEAHEVVPGWSLGMVRRLLEELDEAGVEPPRDWMTNFQRLRASTDRA